MLFRRRVRRHLVSGEIRRTPCVVDVGPRRTICRNPPVGNVVTLLSVRESVSNKVLTDLSLKICVSLSSSVVLSFGGILCYFAVFGAFFKLMLI